MIQGWIVRVEVLDYKSKKELVMIELDTILRIENDRDYKLHLAMHNGEDDPLELFVNERESWQAWNEYKSPYKDEFNRQFIFSLIRFPSQKNRWLFGGIYEVLDRSSESYVIRLSNQHKEFIGRLLVDYQGAGARGRSFLFENQYPKMRVAEIFDREYTGETFEGFDNINMSFYQLENIFKKQQKEWMIPLQSIKGVYLITDKSNGKMYVGSAYGDYGIWSRWETYILTGHGWNEGLTTVINECGIEYARENFQFSLLEFYSMKIDSDVVRGREQYWKEVLCTRQFGYNLN